MSARRDIADLAGEACAARFNGPNINGSDQSGRWICTRPPGHTGVHLAHGMDDQLIAVSPDGRPDTPAFAPTPQLLAKIGSIARHADELTSPATDAADTAAIRSLLADPEVIEWMHAMDALALLPVKR